MKKFPPRLQPPHGSTVIKNKKAAAKAEQRLFNDETIRSLHEYGVVLRQIHNRLVSEGYVIRAGKIFKPEPPPDTNGDHYTN